MYCHIRAVICMYVAPLGALLIMKIMHRWGRTCDNTVGAFLIVYGLHTDEWGLVSSASKR
eukprot:14338462-Ditylum_brightwellii.AAC.1